MGELTEVIFTSDASGQLWNACVWNCRTGTSLMHYKAGVNSAVPKSLNILGVDYLLSADSHKPIIHIWPLNSQEQVSHFRFVTPGKVTCLSISPDNNYCIAAIEEKMYIWQICSGKLLGILSRHYQQVNCIKFTDCSTHFVSGGEDGMLIVWSLSTVITSKNSNIFSQLHVGRTDPRTIFSDHSLPVTDIYVGKCGLQCRFVSVSLDRTCKVYDFSSQKLLLTVIFDLKLTAVTLNWTETLVFVGCENGDIFEFSLLNPPRTKEYHVNSKDALQIFKEHDKRVTCLSVSLDNETLLSGSDDERVLIWNIPSKICLRTIPHKGPITNAFFSIAYKNIFAEHIESKIILRPFQRSIASNEEDSESIFEIVNIDNDYISQINENSENISLVSNTNPTSINEDKLKQEIDTLKKLNYDLYRTAMKTLVEKHSVDESRAVSLKSKSLTNSKRKRK